MNPNANQQGRAERTHIREASPRDIPGIARAHVDSWQSAYRGIVRDEYLDSLTYEKCIRTWERRLAGDEAPFLYVAVQPGEGIVGFAACGPERKGDAAFAGELHAIYLRPGFERRGIGRRLVAAVARRLLREGISSMLVWVLRDNPARGFYEALGGRRVRERVVVIGDEELVELAYGWDDIQTVAAAGQDEEADEDARA